jgi:hypothetical protein
MLAPNWKECLVEKAEEEEFSHERKAWGKFMTTPNKTGFDDVLRIKLIETFSVCMDTNELQNITRNLTLNMRSVILHHESEIRRIRNSITHDILAQPARLRTIWENITDHFGECRLFNVVQRIQNDQLLCMLTEPHDILTCEDMRNIALADMLTICREEVYLADKSNFIWSLFQNCNDIVSVLGLENIKRLNQLRNIVCEKYGKKDWKTTFNTWIDSDVPFEECMRRVKNRVILDEQDLARLESTIHMGNVLHMLWTSKFKIRHNQRCKAVAQNMKECLEKRPDLLNIPILIIEILRIWEKMKINPKYECKFRNIGSLLAYIGCDDRYIFSIYDN